MKTDIATWTPRPNRNDRRVALRKRAQAVRVSHSYQEITMAKTFSHLLLICGLGLGTSLSPALAQMTPDLKGQKLTTADFGGGLQKSFREGWVEPFEKATGAKVTMD